MLDELAKLKVKSLDEHVQLFALTAERKAWGHATSFHAGIAAIRRDIASSLYTTLVANPDLLKEKLDELAR
jgi:hypothetical protein